MKTIGHGRYLCETTPIGDGGYGEVFRATDLRLDQERAVKLLQEGVRHGDREARFMATLEKTDLPIVTVYDFGFDEREKRHYLVMRLLEGGTLATKLRGRKSSPYELWPTVQRIGRALQAVHKNHIIHRDIKPANILYDKEGHAFLSDFGIAYSNVHTTMIPDSSGTYEYMAPEQWLGQAITAQTDLYQWGVTLYEAMAGRRPFVPPPSLSAQERRSWFRQAHLSQPVPRLATFLPGTSPLWQAFFDQALAKEPQKRFRSADAMTASFQALISAESPIVIKIDPPRPPAVVVATPQTWRGSWRTVHTFAWGGGALAVSLLPFGSKAQSLFCSNRLFEAIGAKGAFWPLALTIGLLTVAGLLGGEWGGRMASLRYGSRLGQNGLSPKQVRRISGLLGLLLFLTVVVGLSQPSCQGVALATLTGGVLGVILLTASFWATLIARPNRVGAQIAWWRLASWWVLCAGVASILPLSLLWLVTLLGGR